MTNKHGFKKMSALKQKAHIVARSIGKTIIEMEQQKILLRQYGIYID